jgi:hypothetical protein
MINNWAPQSGSVIAFESSNFKQITWNGDGTIDVEYHKGAVYRYSGVPPVLWMAVERAAAKSGASLGKALREELILKSDIYPYERIK